MGAPRDLDALIRQGLRAVPLGDAGGQLRTGTLHGRPVAGLVGPRSVVLVRLDDGTVLLDKASQDGQVFLDVAIEDAAAFVLTWADGSVVCDLLLGEDSRRWPEPVWQGADEITFPGALRVVDGSVHALIHTETEVLYLGEREDEDDDDIHWPVLHEFVDAAVEVDFLDVVVPPGDPHADVLFGAAATIPTYVGGGGQTSADWFAANMRVEFGSIEKESTIYDLTDIWCGYLGNTAVMAYPSDWSVQVRRLDTGDLVSFRVLREARSDGPRLPRSVAFGAGTLCAVLWEERVAVIDWDDGSVVDQRRIASPGDRVPRHGVVRLLQAGADAWMVGVEDGVVWFDQVRSRPLLRSSRTEVLRSWRSVNVAPDSRVVVGIDADGEAQVRYGSFYNPDSFGFPPDGRFTIGSGPWAAVAAGSAGPINTFVGLKKDGSTVAGHCTPPGWEQLTGSFGPTDDPVTAIAPSELGNRSLFGHASGAISPGSGDWREDGPVRKLITFSGYVVVLVALNGDEENCVVRVRTQSGALMAERHVGWVKDLDVMGTWDDIWIAVSSWDPDRFTTLRVRLDRRGVRSGTGAVEVVYEQIGVDAAGIALNIWAGRPILGMRVDRLLHVVDALDGSPLGIAPLDEERWLLVEGPGGLQFLAGDGVQRVAEPGKGAAVRPRPLERAQLQAGDVRTDRRWRRLDDA